MEEKSIHKFSADFKLDTILETDIGNLYFYGNIVIFEGNEGIVLSYKSGFSILLKGLKILKSNPWILIPNRLNSYSIEPVDFKYLNNIPTLKAVAVVNYSKLAEMNSELESKFCKKPFKTFQNVPDAINWSKTYL
ncbi:hypothetical protein [Aequorivita sublithincola]|nr:hypothetical protein [Aequorivita sublithincola]